MPETKRKCFVMMPFVPELHYFYLYIKEMSLQKNMKISMNMNQISIWISQQLKIS
jgi:hypothetical protein